MFSRETTGHTAWKNVWWESRRLLQKCIGTRIWNEELGKSILTCLISHTLTLRTSTCMPVYSWHTQIHSCTHTQKQSHTQNHECVCTHKYARKLRACVCRKVWEFILQTEKIARKRNEEESERGGGKELREEQLNTTGKYEIGCPVFSLHFT